MAQIIPAGGAKMEWIRDPEAVVKKAQDMFEDDPQLDAIKGLPGMQDGIAELENMSNDLGEVTPADPAALDLGDVAGAGGAGGAVEQAIEKVKDAAQGVADAAVKDVEKAVTDAVKNVGKPVVEPVSDKVDDIKPDAHEDGETPAKEAKEEHEKSETEVEEIKEEECEVDVPGVTGDDNGIEKEGDDDDEDDKDEKGEKPCPFAAAKGMRRLAELSADETKELRHYWKDLLGFPAPYVDAMLKKYRA